MAVRTISVGDGELLPRSRRSAVVHVSAGGVRPALSGALPSQGAKPLKRFRIGKALDLCPDRLRDVQPPAVEIERSLHRWSFERRYDPVGIDVVTRASRNQHDSAAIDQFPEARMMVELVCFGRTGDDHRSAGLHAGENTGAPRGQALFERVAECTDLVEQPEYFVVGGNIAADDDVVDDTQFVGAGVKFLLDHVDAPDEGSDIDHQWP